MKTYSTSKHLVVVFVIVLLLSLPYAFAGKPDKPGNPQEEPTTWSVYIPVDDESGLQGVPDEVPVKDSEYVFDGLSPATRNFANVNKLYYQIWSYFNFEVLFIEGETLPVVLNGITSDSCSEEDAACTYMFAQIKGIQPNGDYSQRVYFGFSSYVDFDYTDQEIGVDYQVSLSKAYFYIDRGTGSDAFRNYINGEFDGCCSLTRDSENTWHIVCNTQSISAHQDESEYTEVCKGKKCYPYYYPAETVAEGTATYQKSFELFFVREPVQ